MSETGIQVVVYNGNSTTYKGSGASIKVNATPAKYLQTSYVFDNSYEFPNRGKEGCVYIDASDNASYRWDEEKSSYFCIGRDYNEINSISVIGGNS